MTQPTSIRRVRGHRPRVLDLFCCQGGAGKGYADAGFDVTGVDKDTQPRYPCQFGLSLRRHRVFETSWGGGGVLVPPCWHRKGLLAFEHKAERAYADAMGCTWMTNLEARKAVPPAYTQWIAAQFLALEGSSAA